MWDELDPEVNLDPPNNDALVVFTAEIRLPVQELEEHGDMQAVQNAVGSTGAQVGSIEFVDQ